MAIARVKRWNPGDVLTEQDLDNEFDNLADNVVAEPFTASQPVDVNGQLLKLDANGDTFLDASVDNTVKVFVGGAEDFRVTANTLTAISGSSIVVESGNITVTSGDMVLTAGRLLQSKATDVASASSITVPTTGNVFDITGTTAITAFSTTQAGTLFYARFTGTGLDITYNATSMITPWARDYKTVPNEVMAFLSLGSGNYTCWSMNGPKERVGVTIEDNVSAAPPGYLEEDGTSYLRTAYPGLFQEIGTTFGAADGTHFSVPDSRGLTAINVDGAANRITAASTNGANADTLGGVGGSETHTLSTSQLPVVNLGNMLTRLTDGGGVNTAAAQSGTDSVGNEPHSVSFGSGGAHSTTQPWIAKKKFIRF